ncbi:cell filamentation protein Fic, partial [Rhodococcus sp. NPDC058485]
MPSRTSKFRSWDDYYIPGTTVLQNKLLVNAAQPYGITDPDMLRKAEERASLIRMAELARDPLPGLFDYAHMKDIHRT